MSEKPSYEALEQRVKALEQEAEKRRMVERELVKRQKYLESVLHHAPDAIVTLDARHRVLEWNPGAEKIFGYSSEEAQGRDLDDLVSLGAVEQQAHANTRTVLSGHPLDPAEVLRYRKDGTPVQVIASGAPILLDGTLQGVVALYTDISERKSAEESLSNANKSLQTILDSIPLDIYVADMQSYEVLFMNEHMQHSFGRNFVGDICWRAFRNASGPCAHCTNPRLLNGRGEPAGVHIWEDFNPLNEKWYLNYDRAVPWIDGRYVRIQIAVDLTERRQAEEALKDSERTYRNLFNNALVGLGRTRISDGKVLESNAQMARIFGYDDVEAFIREYLLSEHYVDQDVRPVILEEIREKGFLQNRELQFYRRDGSRVWVRFDTRIFKDKGYMEDVIIDITDEKKAQEESRRLEQQLIQAQKYEALGTLTGGIAHDFNNILGIILGYTEIVQVRLPASDPNQKALGEVKTASLRARDIVSQLLTFARKGKEQIQTIDIRPIVKECLKMLRSTIPASVEFQSDFAEDLDPVKVDGTQIHQIMVNLCTNASHAMEAGGVLQVGLENTRLDADTAAFDPGLMPGSYVKLSVADTGQGISQDDLQRIFDPYYTTKALGKGSGLGLSVVLGIVKTYDGGIRVSSAIGKGTQFEVFLPAARGGSSPAEPATRPEVPGGTERIVYVDDEPMNVELNQQRLEGLGYSVTGMQDPLEALEAIKADPFAFDLLITDMTMPGMTGDRLVAEVLHIRPDALIILCTGHSERISKESAGRLGLAGYLEKPLDLQTLAVAVREVLDGEEASEPGQ